MAKISLILVIFVLAKASQLPPLAEVTAPVVDKFELVASDGTPTSSGEIYNDWGGHQTRITHHADGTIRLVYLYLNATNSPQWRLMKKVGDSGSWVEEATGPTTDDVYMFHVPDSDEAYLVTSPTTTRQSVITLPSLTSIDIPGAWPLQHGRRYAGAGIGPDGTLCVKNFENLPGPYSMTTNTVYMCGKKNDGSWTWSPLVTQYVGVRHAYDYVFPGAIPDYEGFVAVAQRDTLGHSDGYLKVASGLYMFNGIKYYSSGYNSNATWTSHYISAPIDNPFQSNATTVPTKRQTNAFIDSHGLLIGSYYIDYTDNTTMNGQYVVVTDVQGNVLLDKKWSFLPSYGKTIVFEDGGQQLWLIWLNRGVAATQLTVFAIDRITTANFDLHVNGTSGTNLGSAVGTNAIGGTIYFTQRRSGTCVSNFVEGVMPACGEFPNLAGSCSTSTLQKIFYFRIRLPGTGIAPPSSIPPSNVPAYDNTPEQAPLTTPHSQTSAATLAGRFFVLLQLIFFTL